MRKHLIDRGALAIAAGLILAAGCGNAGSGLDPGDEETRIVRVDLYLDRDGSRTRTQLDTVFANARVALVTQVGNDTVRTSTSNQTGNAQFDEVPLGAYRVTVTQHSIGDTLQVQAIDAENINVQAADSVIDVTVRLGFPEFSIRAARALPQGRRVLIRGVVLAGVQSFRDTTSHVADSSGSLRLTQVTLRGGLVGNNPGDSVGVLGITGTRAGQPILDQAAMARFGTRPPPIPAPISTVNASTAFGGSLDAALVLITSAIIVDTAAVAPDFRVRVNDNSGILEIILDALIPFSRGAFRPGRSLNAIGVLVPNGSGSWIFKPRGLGDVVLN